MGDCKTGKTTKGMKKNIKSRPEPAKVESMRHHGVENSICKELRVIYQLLNEDQDEIKVRVRVATAMARKMYAGLLNSKIRGGE